MTASEQREMEPRIKSDEITSITVDQLSLSSKELSQPCFAAQIAVRRPSVGNIPDIAQFLGAPFDGGDR